MVIAISGAASVEEYLSTLIKFQRTFVFEKYSMKRISTIVAAISLLGLILLPAFVSGSSTLNGFGRNSASALSAKYAEMRAFDNYGKWVAPYETPSSIVSTIQSIRISLGGDYLNLFGFIKGPQTSSTKIGSTTLDSYLVQVKQAAGGDIIPDLNLDYYVNPNHKYCDPKNPSNCGPTYFFQVSQEYLSLSAVSQGSRTVFLESWDTFNRYESQATIQSVFNELHSQGWKILIIHQLGPQYFPDSGLGVSYQATSIVPSLTSSPYMQPNTAMVTAIHQHAPSEAAMVHFDRQIQNSAKPPTALAVFLSSLTPAEQAAALTNLAALQSKDNYIFVYPLMTYTSRNGVTYTWDATHDRQSNGQPFLSLIEQLILQYG